jgi:hypothetical protein
VLKLPPSSGMTPDEMQTVNGILSKYYKPGPRAAGSPEAELAGARRLASFWRTEAESLEHRLSSAQHAVEVAERLRQDAEAQLADERRQKAVTPAAPVVEPAVEQPAPAPSAPPNVVRLSDLKEANRKRWKRFVPTR